MAQRAEQKKGPTGDTDYSLLLKRLENAVLHDRGAAGSAATLKNRGIWEKLEVHEKLQWASLAQIAGMVDVAIEIYEAVTNAVPDNRRAWMDYLDLVAILDRRKALAALVARAGKYLDGDELKEWKSVTGSGVSKKEISGFDSVAAPFESMILKRELMERYLELFSGREDIFARQWADRAEHKAGYVPVRHAMGLKDVEDHLQGRKTYGIYLLNSRSRVRLGVIDVDIVPGLRTGKLTSEKKTLLKRERAYLMSRIGEASAALNLKPLVEFSGYKGYHFWYFFSEPVEAGRVKSILKQIAEPVARDLTAFDLEVFPKQNTLSGKGLGNLVKLPLGIHRFTGKPSFFLECGRRDLDSQLLFLKEIVPADPDVLNGAVKSQAAERVILHPKTAGYAKEYPELFGMEQACPPLGRLIASARGRDSLGVREEKVLYQTMGFLPRGRTLLHYLMAFGSEYNPHMVDFKLSRLRGSVLGCRRIHSLLGFTGDFCDLDPGEDTYQHPLLHLPEWRKCREKKSPKSSKIENLQDALENMKTAIIQVQKFMG